MVKSLGIMLAAIASSFLTAYILLSIADTYGLTFITQFKFIQILGLISIIGLVGMGFMKVREKEKTNGELVEQIIYKTVAKLIMWGIAILIFKIFG